jgi:hypothetical protein
MLLRRRGTALVVGWVIGCGARSEPGDLSGGWLIEPGPAVSVEDWPCLDDRGCNTGDLCRPARCFDGRCRETPPIACDDGDPCTEGRCDSETGQCEHEPLTPDEDGDGFRAPLPGFAPGAPGSCGDDCDDTNPAAYPGATEYCDGADNNCDGIVDDGAEYLPMPGAPLLVPDPARQSSAGGLTHTGQSYVAAIAAQRDAWESRFVLLSRDGTRLGEERAVTRVNADTFSGPVVWTGRRLASAWEDRRDGAFEIYFNRFDAEGDKLGPDLRLTHVDDFSLRPSLLFTGTDFVIVWGDRRHGVDGYRIYGQRVDLAGALLGANVELTPSGLDAETPRLAQTHAGLGMVFNVEGAGGRQVAFRTLAPDLTELGEVMVLGDFGSVGASVVATGDRYVVAWTTRDVVPGPSIRATVLGADGRILVPPRPITGPAPFARSHAMLALGDRVLLVWSEDRGGGYRLYTKQLDLGLDDLTETRLISTEGVVDATSPVIAFGSDGDVGVLFEDVSSGAWQVYFSRLACAPGAG